MIDIQAENLIKIYGDKRVLDRVSLEIDCGKIFGLFGPNGSGKSTLVKIFTGLITPTDGEYRILGEVPAPDNLELKRRIGVLPEKLALFDTLSIWEHILMMGEIYEIACNEAKYRGEQLLRHLDLWEDRFTRINQCSYGMKKKCSLSLAFLHNPKVVFLDEPFEGVDPVSSRNIRDTIIETARKGCTFFITSHSLEIMEHLADEFAVISRGEIVYRGRMQDEDGLQSAYFDHIKNDVTGDLAWLGR